MRLQLTIGERIVLLSCIPTQGTSAVRRRCLRVKRALRHHELERSFSLAQLRADDSLLDVTLDDEMGTWVSQLYTDKADFAGEMDEWTLTLGEKLLNARMASAQKDEPS